MELNYDPFPDQQPDEALSNYVMEQPIPEGSAQKKRIGSFILENGVDLADPPLLNSAVIEQGDKARLQKANEIVHDPLKDSSQKAEEMGNLSGRMGTEDEPDAIEGMGRTLGASEPQLPKYVTDWSALYERQNKGVAKATKIFDDLRQQGRAQALDKVAGADGKIAWSGTLGALAGSAKHVLEAGLSFIWPEYQVQLANIITKYVPDNHYLAYLGDSSLYGGFRQFVLEHPDQAENIAKDVRDMAIAKQGTFWENGYELEMMGTELVTGLNGERGALDNVFQFVDFVSLVPILGTLAKVSLRGTLLAGIGAKALAGLGKGGALDAARVAQKGLRDRAVGLIDDERKARAASESVDDLDEALSSLDKTFADATKQLDDLEAALGGKKITVESLEEASRKKAAGEKLSPVDDTLASLHDLGKEVDKIGGNGPRVPKGTPADVAISTTAGAKKALEGVADATKLDPNTGMTQEQIIGSLIAPGERIDVDNLSRPWLEDAYFTQRAREAIIERERIGLFDRWQVRLKDTEFKFFEGRTVTRATIGAENGRGYKTAQEAEAQAKELGQPYALVEKDGEHFFQIEQSYTHRLSDIATDEELVRSPKAALALTGKNNYMTELFLKMSGAAVMQSSVAEGIAKRLIRPYNRLNPIGKARVNDALRKGQAETTWWSDVDLVGKFNLKPREIRAYRAVKDLADRDHAMANFFIRQTLLDRGFDKIIKVGERTGIGRKLKEGETVGEHASMVNPVTGRIVTKVDQAKGDVVYQLAEAFEDGTTHLVFKGGKVPSEMIDDLPLGILKKVDGYYGRQRYGYPFYISKHSVNEHGVKVTKTVAGARSQKEALEWIARNRGELKKGESFSKPLYADEIVKADRELDPLANAKSQGMLKYSHKNPDILEDASNGKPIVRGVSETVNAMVRRYGDNAGMARFNQAMLNYLNRRYGKPLGINFTIGGKAPKLEKVGKDPELEKDYKKAVQLHRNIQRNAGLSPELEGFDALHGYNMAIANFLWNTKFGPAQYTGDVISGLNKGPLTTAKTVSFANFLGTNFPRQPILQSSQIPTYLGVEGAKSYMFAGSLVKDWNTLALARLPFGVGLDMARRINPQLVKDYFGSGLDDLVHNHLLSIGTVNDSRVRAGGWVDYTLGNTFRAMQASGFNLGVTNEKFTTYLIARNKWFKRNGRYASTPEEMQEVSTMAEGISMNMNQSDVLPFNNGYMGLVTQFLSYNAKFTGRLLGREANFTPSEKMQMMIFGGLSYGFDFMRVGELLDSYEKKTGQQIPRELKEILRQGFLGASYNIIGRALLDDNGAFLDSDGVDDEGKRIKQSQVDVSSNVGAANFVGPSVQFGTEIIEAIGSALHLDFDIPEVSDVTAFDYGFSVPFLSLVGNMAEVGYFAYKMFTPVIPKSISVEKRMAAAARKFLSKAPLTNSIVKAFVASNKGYSIDSHGDPELEVTELEARSAIFGFSPHQKSEINQAWGDLMGDYHEQDPGKLQPGLKQTAEDNADLINEVVNGLGGEKISLREAYRLSQEHTDGMSWMFKEDPQKRVDYFRYFFNAMKDRGILKNDKLTMYIIKNLRNGNLKPGQEMIDAMRQYNFDGQEQIIQFIEGQMRLGKEFGDSVADEFNRGQE